MSSLPIDPRKEIPPAGRRKFSEWIARYGPAEIVGTLAALGGSFLIFHLTRSAIAAAYGGALGENVGFYGTIFSREFCRDLRGFRASNQRYHPLAAAKLAGGLLVEFGPAELLDSFLIRPLCMGIGTRYLGRAIGVIIGKLASDITFYVPVIVSYEMKKAARYRRSID